MGRKMRAAVAAVVLVITGVVGLTGAALASAATPTITQTLELPGTDPNAGSFGTSVAMDGTTLVVGDPGVNGGGGAVYVYTEAPGGWQATSTVPAATLTPAGAQANGSDAFGSSVAIDGAPGAQTIVVGAPTGRTGAGNATGDGAAFIFSEPAGGWQTQASTIPPLGVANPSGSDDFGTSVAVSGTTVVVGADEAGNSSNGAAFVYTNLTAPAPANPLTDGGTSGSDEFGTSVAVSASPTSTQIVVGAPGADNVADAAGNGEGSAFVYSVASVASLTGLNPTQLAIPGGGNGGDDFGTSVAISGSTIVIGADASTSSENGAAYVYPAGGAPLTLQVPGGGPGTDAFGSSVAISGTTVAVGASGTAPDASTNQSDGAAYTFDISSATSASAPTAELTASDGAGAGNELGSTVAVSPTGVASGAAANSPGLAYVYSPQLTVSVTGSGGVTSLDGTINCGATCTASYAPGTTETLTPSASPGWTFTGWSGACSGMSCQLSVTSSETATANFALQGGLAASISSPAGGGTYAVGQSVPTSFSCTQGSYAPAIQSCTDSNGVTAAGPSFAGTGSLNTQTPGTHTYSVTPVDANGTSYAPATITYTVVATPTNQAAPTIIGSDSVGSTLNCSTGQWSSSPSSFTYVWEQNGTPISGATSGTYTLMPGDAGTTIACVVTAANAVASGTASSTGLAVPAASPSSTTTTSTTSGTPAALAISAGTVTDGGTELRFSCSSAGHTLTACTVTVTAGHTVVATGRVGGNARSLAVNLKLTRAGLALALANPSGLKLTVLGTGSVEGAGTAKHSKAAVLSFTRQVLIPSEGMFEPNSPQLTAFGSAFLSSAARQIGTAERVICVGYTAAPGGSLENNAFSLTLSRQRAKAACAYLVKRHVSAVYETEGVGKRDPLVPNTTPANLARNRRVEFLVTGKLRING